MAPLKQVQVVNGDNFSSTIQTQSQTVYRQSNLQIKSREGEREREMKKKKLRGKRERG